MPDLNTARRAQTKGYRPALPTPLPAPTDVCACCTSRHAGVCLLLWVSPASTTLDLQLNVGGIGTADAGVQNSAPDVGALLAAVAVRRDRNAFASLFAFYSPRLKGHLLTRGAPSTIAEEIVQDVMLAVWRKAEQFDPSRGSVGAWIFAFARNAFIDRVRREYRPTVDAADPLLIGEQQPAADQLVLDAESHRELAAAVQELPPEQRHVLHRSYFQGESLAQISAAEGLPIGTVKTRARLALSRLRALVMAKGTGGQAGAAGSTGAAAPRGDR